MSAIRRSLAPSLLLSFALTMLAQAPSGAEEMTAIAVAPRVGEGGDSPVRAHGPSRGEGMTLIRVGPRVGIGGDSPLGEEQKANFQQYDVAALFRLPWGRQEWASGLKFGTRLLTTVGELAAAGRTSVMATMVPLLALSSRNDGISVDIGVGGGLFSNYNFGVQNFGGPFQIVGTVGIGVHLFTNFHAGYRFQHFSDAGIYGPTSLGADMHILELSYPF